LVLGGVSRSVNVSVMPLRAADGEKELGAMLMFEDISSEKRMKSTMSRYMDPAIAAQMLEGDGLDLLGGANKEATVMFTDVRGFTTISEQFDPQGLTRFMNRFLTPMTDLILGLKGTIDKYMGDAIMAFWNAPLPVERHAARACDAALAMQSRLAVLNEEWKAEAEAEGRRHIPVNIGVGLNTGPASVGNFGSTQRFTYSCLGDDVNLASRLEGQCKTYGVGIIIGRKTREAVEDYATLEIDLITVKGKTEPERVYVLLGDASVTKTPAHAALVERQDEFLRLYRSGAFAEALATIETCQVAADAAGWRQSYYQMMRGRLDELIDDSPVDWKGVYVAKDK
jgi:adenylate cyclase